MFCFWTLQSFSICVYMHLHLCMQNTLKAYRIVDSVCIIIVFMSFDSRTVLSSALIQVLHVVLTLISN